MTIIKEKYLTLVMNMFRLCDFFGNTINCNISMYQTYDQNGLMKGEEVILSVKMLTVCSLNRSQREPNFISDLMLL